MKLALCFSGESRTFEKCIGNITEKLLSKYDCDVFISTYYESEEISKKILKLYNPKKITFNDRNIINKIVNVRQLDKIKTKYFESIGDASYNCNKESNDIGNFFHNHENIIKLCSYDSIQFPTLCQFFGINQVAVSCKEYMLENNINYDYILRLRLDSFLDSDFKIIHLEEDELLVNYLVNYNFSIKPNDYYFMARPNAFFKTACIYLHIDFIIKFINNNKCWLPRFGYQETILFITGVINNLKFKEYDIIRLMK